MRKLTQVGAIRKMGYDPEKLGAKNVDGQIFKPDAIPDQRGPCRICGRPGVMIAGCGSYLCERHQDDY